jgi:uncharacterized membrane protein
MSKFLKIDSLLGATVQYSGFSSRLQVVMNKADKHEEIKSIGGFDLLSNNQVNFVSASLTSICAVFIHSILIGQKL